MAKYVSKGEVGHSMKLRRNKPGDRLLNQMKAFKAGKRVMLVAEPAELPPSPLPKDWEPERLAGAPKIPAKYVWGAAIES